MTASDVSHAAAQGAGYHFVTRWRVPGSCGEVADVLGDPLSLVRWWPAVYLQVTELDPSRPDGTGRRFRMLTKGWLPYTLAWELTVIEQRYPNRIVLEAAGDFVGLGVWTFAQDGGDVEVTYDWRIRAEKPLLRRLSFLLRPAFEANHRWAMAQGETSLRLELDRRRATSPERRAQVPPPPGPVTYSGVALVGGAVLVGAGVAYLVRRAGRASRARRRQSRRRCPR